MRDLWEREPVRAAIYPIILLIVGFLTARGVVDGETGAFILALAALILGAVGVEVARSKVTPDDKSDA